MRIWILILVFNVVNAEQVKISDIHQAYKALELPLDKSIEEGSKHQLVAELTNLRAQMLSKMEDLTETRALYDDALQLYQQLRKPLNNISQVFQNVANNEALGPIIVIIPVTSAYVPLAKNFLCYLRALNNAPKVLLWAVDNNAFELLDSWTDNVFKFESEFTKIGNLEGSLQRKSLPLPLRGDLLLYHQMMLGRNRIANEALQAGYHVLLADIDQVWLSNPFSYLQKLDGIMGMVSPRPEEPSSYWFTSAFLFVPNTKEILSAWKKLVGVYENVLTDISKKTESSIPLLHLEEHLINSMISVDKLQVYGLNADLFANGEHFFKKKIPQQKGIRPVIIHCDLMEGLLAKRTLLKRRAMWMISDRGEQCPLHNEIASTIRNNTAKAPLVAIKLLTFNRPASLLRCLVSLRNAEYMGNTIPLDIFIDYDSQSTSFPPAVLQIADEFFWPHGPKKIHYRSVNAGITNQWLEAWYPSLEISHSFPQEFAFFVEDDMEVSPFYYRWLLAAIQEYYLSDHSDSRKLFGISLQEIQIQLNQYPKKFPVTSFPTNQSILYQLPSTWGVLYSPRHWKAFRIWYEAQTRKNQGILQRENSTMEHALLDPHLRETLSPFIPGNLVSNQWYQFSGGKLFLAWLLRYTWEKQAYFLYPQLPKYSLVVNHQEIGEFQKEPGGPNSILLQYEEEIVKERPLYSMASLNSLSVVDFCGRIISRSAMETQSKQIIC